MRSHKAVLRHRLNFSLLQPNINPTQKIQLTILTHGCGRVLIWTYLDTFGRTTPTRFPSFPRPHHFNKRKNPLLSCRVVLRVHQLLNLHLLTGRPTTTHERHYVEIYNLSGLVVPRMWNVFVNTLSPLIYFLYLSTCSVPCFENDRKLCFTRN